MARRVNAKLEGDLARLGDVPAVDVARMILGIERAIARSAAQIAGRRPGLSGRRGGAVEASTRLRLVAIESGSVVPILELPDLNLAPGDFLLDDSDLGELALDATIATILGNQSDPDVADALAGLAEEIGIGTRYEALTLSTDLPTGERREARIDRLVRDRLRATASSPDAQRVEDTVVGTLVEADFERNTARLRTTQRDVVTVSFSPELADTIQDVLRRQAELVGRVRYDTKTGAAVRVDVEQVLRTEQLLFDVDADEFWRHETVDDLLKRRTDPVATNARDLEDTDASDAEIDAFFEALSE